MEEKKSVMLRLASRRPFLPFSLRAAAGSGPDVALRRELRTEQQRRCMSGEKEEQDSTQEGEAAKVAEDAAATDADGSSDAPQEEGEVDALTAAENRIAELEADAADAKQKYMGVLAEMENVRRIAKNDVAKANTYAIQKFAKSLLPVSDNLGRALEAVPQESLADAPKEFASLHEGIVMTQTDLMGFSQAMDPDLARSGTRLTQLDMMQCFSMMMPARSQAQSGR